VRLKETPAGTLIQFEVPGIQGEGILHRLSLEHLFAYSGLAGEGLTDPQALVKSALVIAEAVDPATRVARKDVEEAHARLRAIQGRIPPARPVLEALLEAADAVVEREIRKEKDQEQLAKETFERGLRFLGEDPRDPLEAKRLFELLLSGSLSRTAFAKERRGHFEDLHRQAEAQIRDNKLNSVFPGARIEEAPGVVSGESLSRMTFSFDGTAGDALRGLLAPEDGGPRLYAVVPEDVDGHAGGGCVRFVEGAGGRGLRDNPLEMECPFKSSPSRPILVSFRYRSEAPLYLQVSIAGVHVGILTDDGRRTSGRGVYAWLSEDWRDPDRAFPIQYRHDWIERQYAGRDPAKEVIKEGAQQGQRYFQLEPGREYKVRVEWSQKRLKLFVDDQRIWLADLGYAREARPRIRIVTFTPAWVDDLVVEGVVDRQHLERLSQGK